jgi:hypothetical protein
MADMEEHLSVLVDALNSSSHPSPRATDKRVQQQPSEVQAEALHLLGKLAHRTPPPPIKLEGPLCPIPLVDRPTNSRHWPTFPRITKFTKRPVRYFVMSGLLALVAIGVWWTGFSFSGQQTFRYLAGRLPFHKSSYELAKAAMAKCDEAATKQPDDLYALVIPLKPALDGAPAPSGVAFGSLVLLPSSEALAALQNRALVVDHKRYTLSIRDSATQAISSWDPEEGIFQFSKSDAASLTTLSFGLSIEGGAVSWGARFARQRGVCYWIQVLVRDQ